MKRMVDDDPVMALAAYQMKVVRETGSKYALLEGKHVGIFDRREDAEAWLKTGKPRPKRIRVVPVR